MKPNPWNPNRQAPEIFEREIRSIKRHGFIDPITVRENAAGETEIVDGEHRWRAAMQMGLDKIPATHLGKLSEEDARRLTILFNELRGEPEPMLLSKLLQELVQFSPPEELSKDLPMEAAEIDAMVKAVEFSWDSLNPTPGNGEPVDFKLGSEERRFVLGGLQGYVPTVLADALLAEYEQSAKAISSNNLELVLKHLVDRLKANRPDLTPAPTPPAGDAA